MNISLLIVLEKKHVHTNIYLYEYIHITEKKHTYTHAYIKYIKIYACM